MDNPIAVLALSNWGGITILEIDDYTETVSFQWYDDEPETTYYYYDEDEAFFLVGDTKYYFNEFMRIQEDLQ